MIFSSLIFVYGFLPVSLILYYITSEGKRNYTLLALSLIFCTMSGLGFLLFIFSYTIINYVFGRLCGMLRRFKFVSGAFSAVAITVNIFILLLFRENIFDAFLEKYELLEYRNFVVPIGISFMTLSAIGYQIDICCGRIKAERNFLKFALYMVFFPKLIIGPLVGYSGFSRMIENRRTDLYEVGKGLKRFVIGLAKKVIFADNIYMLFSAVKLIDVENLSSLSAWMGIFAYCFCIYFTLSGFSDMSVGIARCFGLRLPSEFKYPILSSSIGKFCSRWQITVVKWFNRYAVKPLTRKFKYKIFRYVLIIAVWGIIGIWYDMRLNMFVWGLLIGIAASSEGLVKNRKMPGATSVIYTFSLLSILSVFFFGDDLTYSMNYYFALIGGNGSLADSVSLYLLKSYVVILLVCAYSSTDMFRNLIERSKKKFIQKAADFISPAVIIGILVMCTAEMSYSGVSYMMLPILREVSM